MILDFEKWQGTGNDFIMIDNWDQKTVLTPENIQRLCNRNFGIGADAVILVEQSKKATAKMNYYNSDGTPAETCGNGIRCTASFVKQYGYAKGESFSIENPNGSIAEILFLSENPLKVRVNFGSPSVKGGKDFPENFLGKEIIIKGQKISLWCVSTENPHVGIFVENVKKFPVEILGPQIECHSLFPNRINVEFIEVLSEKEARVRVWERGVGETLACGSAAVAVGVIGILSKKFTNKEPITIHLPGGDLEIFWDQEKNTVFKTGEAEKVFSGKIEL
jgi:diaminopimelate epimerase